jgi:hypothetical protein
MGTGNGQEVRATWARKGVLLALLVAGVVIVVVKVSRTGHAVGETTTQIEAELGALPPAERAAVVAKLGADAARQARSRRAGS